MEGLLLLLRWGFGFLLLGRREVLLCWKLYYFASGGGVVGVGGRDDGGEGGGEVEGEDWIESDEGD